MVTRLAVCRSLDRLKQRRTVNFDGFDLNGNEPTPDLVVGAAELDRVLRTAVANLPERQREAFSLRYFESLPNKEIAAVMGITDSAVSTAIHKARTQLEYDLADYCERTN